MTNRTLNRHVYGDVWLAVDRAVDRAVVDVVGHAMDRAVWLDVSRTIDNILFQPDDPPDTEWVEWGGP